MTAVSVPTPVEARGGWGWGPGIAEAYGYGPGYGYYGPGPGPGYGYYGWLCARLIRISLRRSPFPSREIAGRDGNERDHVATNPCIRPSNGKAEYARKLAVGSRPCGRPCRS